MKVQTPIFELIKKLARQLALNNNYISVANNDPVLDNYA